jgi:hypothetical protein
LTFRKVVARAQTLHGPVDWSIIENHGFPVSRKGVIMTRTAAGSSRRLHRRKSAWVLSSLISAGLTASALGADTVPNLLQNPDFEAAPDATGALSHWNIPAGANVKPLLTEQFPHGGKQALTLPAHAAVEQTVNAAKAGPYMARAWVNSQIDQTIALLVQDPNQPWVGYAYAEVRLPANQWTQVEAFCSLQKDGNLSFTLGELSADFRNYHGVRSQTRSPIVVDDLELVRFEPPSACGPVTVWDVKPDALDWSKRSQWSQAAGNAVTGTGVLQTPRLVGMVHPKDGSLAISAIQSDQIKPRCTLVPSTPISNAKCSLLTDQKRKGLKISSETGDVSYTAWFTPEGLVSVTADHIPQFQVRDCRLRYGLLPSFVGTDVLYAPQKMEGTQFTLPSTQWLVGLVDGNDSMLVAAWESDTQAVSLGLSGEGEMRQIESLTIATAKAGFSLGLVEHANLWHKEPLKEEWLGAYTPIAWQRPFPARWMGQFFVAPATRPTFRQPNLDYSFPIASARTRQWGVWFEDTNNYPLYFDGPHTILHFDKTFVPRGDALFYFLEPAAADLYSPCEIVEQALGRDRALALFDFDANGLRKLTYSTPDEFMYDRPVCATTTRMNTIKLADKATVGVNLATHIYEFIREIRCRVDQYGVCFTQMQDYLASEKKAHPELKDYLEELEAMVTDTQNRTKAIYSTSLPSVQVKTDSIKDLLLEGTGDGFAFGNLDCRNTAGAQDDMCRHCNRFVMRLVQTAALKCGDSPQKAKIAKKIWDEARAVLRQPTRWESRRTLCFLEP